MIRTIYFYKNYLTNIMNIIISLGTTYCIENNYSLIKSITTIYENLNINYDNKIFIIYYNKQYDFEFLNKYSQIIIIKIKTNYNPIQFFSMGLYYILKKYTYHSKCLILDINYLDEIVDIFHKNDKNIIFYNNDKIIGYGYNDILLLYKYCNIVSKLNYNIHDNIINEMINNGIEFIHHKMDNTINLSLEKVDFKKLIKQNIELSIDNIIIDEYKIRYHNDIISLIIISGNYKLNYILKYRKNSLVIPKKLELYEREYYFYNKIVKYSNIKVPKLITLVKDENKNNVGLLLEKLKFRHLDLNVENIDISLKTVDMMIRFHIKFWNKNFIKLFPKLKKNNDFNSSLKELILQKIDIFKEKWGNILTPVQLNICDILINNFVHIENRLSIGNLTIINGNFRSSNILYDNNEPYFIDWQFCCVGKGVQDLILFIIDSYEINNINLLYNILINYYYKKLLEYKIINYSFNDYEQDINDAISYIPFFTAIWFGSIQNNSNINSFITKLFYLIEKIF